MKVDDMSDRLIERLATSAMHSAALDDPSATDLRSPDCLSMSRLDLLASGGAASDAERRHLAACGLCRARLGGFRAPSVFAPEVAVARAPWRLVRTLGIAAAACLAVLLVRAPRDLVAPGHDDGSTVRLAGSSVPVTVCHDPAPDALSEPRVDRFAAASDEPCVVLAVFRAWDEGCQCLLWQLHEWDEQGHTRVMIVPDEALDIEHNVTGDPPIEQVLLVAASRERGAFPASQAEAGELLQCLNTAAPPAPGGETDQYVAAVASCLPPSVTVVPQSFFVD